MSRKTSASKKKPRKRTMKIRVRRGAWDVVYCAGRRFDAGVVYEVSESVGARALSESSCMEPAEDADNG